ncbi:MORC family CW-type zinc finger protein 3-like [Ictalurus furcatus]|uniref:MORC family CW-type zinc finger protein 3-like n=1 Tax=Ictalurus furcatus TaxID=66913 RepID=UPI0023500E4A|nr:MORC family CW-type zinc finger protein 3-like [Ictalurus furcatus]
MAAVTSRGIPLSSVSPQYLHANSTSHTWPFSAIAELIDNAYDPDVSAKQLWIDKSVIKGQDCLIFMDNGKGMDYDKMHKMLSFGFSDKQTVNDHVPVGRYGNGFKSGSMRLGKDAIVFSKKADTMCVGFLSQTYLEKIKVQTVIVPTVTFTNTGQTVSASPEHAEECLHDILTHSLFNTKEELLSEFSVIDGLCTNSSGTRIIIWNLRRTPSGELEFDFTKNRYDIRIPVDVYGRTGEINKRQAAGGVSVPESEYSLRAYCSILYLKPRMQIIIQGKKVETVLVTKTLANVLTDTYTPASVNKAITITFGYNTKSREHYGLMMYHKNRLIKAYERVACQRKAEGRAVGVIGVIECNHLTPTHSKQDFDDTEDYRKILKNVGKKLEEYWKQQVYAPELKPNCTEDTVKQPDQNCIQCDNCLKWRKLPDGIDPKKLPEKWFCRMNADPQFRSCTDEEEPEVYDDEQPRNQKTYKQHERNQKLQQENWKQVMT